MDAPHFGSKCLNTPSTCVSIYTYTDTHAHRYTYTDMYAHRYTCTHTYVLTGTHSLLHICVCVSLCISPLSPRCVSACAYESFCSVSPLSLFVSLYKPLFSRLFSPSLSPSLSFPFPSFFPPSLPYLTAALQV